jgi:hypothetical protein
MKLGEQLQLFESAPLWTSDEERELHQAQARWPCPACGEMPIPDAWTALAPEGLRPYSGYDPCLGCLSDVLFACCGHCDPNDTPYVVIYEGGSKLARDNLTLYDEEALEYFRSLGVGPPLERDAEQHAT